MTAEQVKAMLDNLKVRVPVMVEMPVLHGRRSSDQPAKPNAPKE